MAAIKFNPIDMEIAIAGHPAVAQVAIAPMPDELLGERASCFVILKTGASLSFDELKAFLAERKFAKFTWPEHLADRLRHADDADPQGHEGRTRAAIS